MGNSGVRTMNWSRIQNTELATEAYILMNENEINGCQYHNNDHIDAMYQYFEETDEPYDEALDWAVMFHDVVYDEHPEKEKRSVRMFYEMRQRYRGFNGGEEDALDVATLIDYTIDHKIYPWSTPTQKAIIRADLHALTSKVDTINNFTKIMNESMKLYDCNIQDFAENNIKFMSGLHQRMAINILNVDEDGKLFFQMVQSGIDLTIRMAQAIKDSK
jgi:predicted metal-dependent HD superfamily phosphohydrolase